MRKYTFIAIGGMLGAMLRYVIKSINVYHYKAVIPNIIGSKVFFTTCYYNCIYPYAYLGKYNPLYP